MSDHDIITALVRKHPGLLGRTSNIMSNAVVSDLLFLLALRFEEYNQPDREAG